MYLKIFLNELGERKVVDVLWQLWCCIIMLYDISSVFLNWRSMDQGPAWCRKKVNFKLAIIFILIRVCNNQTRDRVLPIYIIFNNVAHSQDVLCLNFTNLCLFHSIPRSSYVFSTLEMLSPLIVYVWHVLVEILVCLFQISFISTAVLYTKTLSHNPPIYTLVYLFVAVHNKTQLAKITGRKMFQNETSIYILSKNYIDTVTKNIADHSRPSK